MDNDIILTPMQIQNLKEELIKSKEDYEKALEEMRSYKRTERYTGETSEDGPSTIDDSYFQRLSVIAARIEEIETLLDTYLLAEPKGKKVQIGSIVELELTDRNYKFMVIQKKVTYTDTDPKEISFDSPIVGAIYMHKVGDICEYAANGRALKCVIGRIDNTTCREMTNELKESKRGKTRRK